MNVARINARPVQRFTSFDSTGEIYDLSTRASHVFSQRLDNINKCSTYAEISLLLSNERNNLLSLLCYWYMEYLLYNVSFILSHDKISTGFQRRHYKIKSKLSRLRHSKNVVPFARIESAVASMGVNIRDAWRVRVDRMEFSDWSL